MTSSAQERQVSVNVARIIATNAVIARAWRDVEGWAPKGAAALLSSARLDRQVSLSHCLNIWADDDEVDAPAQEGRLILAWTTLGALVEGTLRWFAAVHFDDYCRDAVSGGSPAGRDGPAEASFERLRTFFARHVWTDTENPDQWVRVVQQRRNTIHGFKDRDLGSFTEFRASVRLYDQLLHDLTARVSDLPSREES